MLSIDPYSDVVSKSRIVKNQDNFFSPHVTLSSILFSRVLFVPIDGLRLDTFVGC